MPIYTYQCAVCGHEIERRQSFSDAPLTTCEACSGSLRRVLHPVGVIFKGSGFYNTDYKKSSSNGSSSNGESSGAQPADGAKKSEAKAGDASKSTVSSTSGESASSSTPASPSTPAATTSS